MTEEPALDQPLGEGGAVHLDEGLVLPSALVVDSGGDEFLARAALAEDEHRESLGRRGRRGKNVFHHLTFTNDIGRPKALADIAFQPEVLVAEFFNFHGPAHEQKEFLKENGLVM